MAAPAIPDLQLLATIKAEFLAAKNEAEAIQKARRRAVITSARNEIMIIIHQRLADIRASIGQPGQSITLFESGRVQIQIHQMNDDAPFPFKENGPFYIDGNESPTVQQLVNTRLFGDEHEDTIADIFMRVYGVALSAHTENINGNSRTTFFVIM